MPPKKKPWLFEPLPLGGAFVVSVRTILFCEAVVLVAREKLPLVPAARAVSDAKVRVEFCAAIPVEVTVPPPTLKLSAPMP